jgi:DNA-binding response OmpR family regulator
LETEAILIGRRILVAEDEGMLAWQIVDLLERAGAEIVGPCASVADLRRKASGERLDGAVLDVNLRGALVFEAAAELRARGVPIVLSSGYSDGAAIFPPEFRDVPRLRKPYELRVLLDLCRSVFAPPATRSPS